LFLLRDGTEECLLQFLSFILAEAPGGPSHREKQRSGVQFDRTEDLRCLRNLIRFFFVQLGDEDWLDSAKIRLIVAFCIDSEVKIAKTAQEVYESDVLNAVFSEICSQTSYPQFLFREICSHKFDLDSLAQTSVENERKQTERKKWSRD